MEYDRPEDPENKNGRKVLYAGLAIAVIVAFYFGFYR
jgi:hypothetical protein